MILLPEQRTRIETLQQHRCFMTVAIRRNHVLSLTGRDRNDLEGLRIAMVINPYQRVRIVGRTRLLHRCQAVIATLRQIAVRRKPYFLLCRKS
jgi:hypothetical protein